MVIEGGKGSDAPGCGSVSMSCTPRRRRTITETEWQEMRGIEAAISRQSARRTAPLSPRPTLGDKPFLIQGDSFSALVD